MTRFLIHVEGQTEEQFVNDVLRPHLVASGAHSVDARLLGARRQRSSRGGIRPWPSVYQELQRNLLKDPKLKLGLLVDYYGLPAEWPGRADAGKRAVADRAALIAASLRNSMPAEEARRFFPCILMHEFETFVFADPVASVTAWGRPDLEAPLLTIRSAFTSVEEINDSRETAPSKRLERLIVGYEKPLMGALAVLGTGLSTLRRECPSFGAWVTELERTTATDSSRSLE